MELTPKCSYNFTRKYIAQLREISRVLSETRIIIHYVAIKPTLNILVEPQK
jgi:hypothetical protein